MDMKVFDVPIGDECPGTRYYNNNVSLGPVATGSNGDSLSRPAPKQEEGERAFPSGKPRTVILTHPSYKFEVGVLVFRLYLAHEIGQTPFPNAKALAHITLASISEDVRRGLQELKRNDPNELSGPDLIGIATKQLLQTYEYVSYGVRLHLDGAPARNGWDVIAHAHGLLTISDEEAWRNNFGDVTSARKARYWVSVPERFAPAEGDKSPTVRGAYS